MSSSGPAASTKKRKPSFRPANNRCRKAKKAAPIHTHEEEDAVEEEPLNAAADADNVAERNGTTTAALPESLTPPPQGIVQLERPEASNLPSGGDDAARSTTNSIKQNPKAKQQRPRKRKTTVLAVGASRGKSPISTALVEVVRAGNQNEESSEASPAAMMMMMMTTTTVGEGASPDGGTTSCRKDSRQQQDLPTANNHMPLELVPPVIPENTTGKPSLSSYCSAFPKPKQRRGGQAAAAPAAQHPAADEPPAPEMLAAHQQQQQQHQQQHAGPVVQIVNGEIVLQESSMVFQGSGAAVDAGDANMTVVEEEAEMAVVGATYTSFATGRRARPKASHWTVEETQLFYEALRQVGLDFGTMEAYFESSDNPNIRKRLRRQLKRKYQAEYTKNPALVEKALQPAGRVDIDLSVFQLTEESIEEMQAEKEKEQSAAREAAVAANAGGAGALDGDDDDDDETDALDKDAAAAAEKPAARQQETRADQDFLWPDAGSVDHHGDENEPADDSVFFEEKDATAVDEGGNEEAPTLALLHGVPSKAAKKKTTTKPKFRSARKKTAKAK